MSTELVTIEKQLNMLIPQFSQLLSSTGVPAERLVRTMMISLENNPKLLECNRQSIFNAAMSAAVLGLEIDGVSGQAFLIPFKGKCQLVTGYKGMNSLAARSGYTINGGVVREGDNFEYMEGTGGYARNKKLLGNEARRPIIAAWAQAEQPGRSPIIAVLSIDELMATKARSPGAKKPDSPWNDPIIGFPAMCEKTAKRRLARGMPLNIMQYAAAMEDQLEVGNPSHIDPGKGVVIEGEAERHEEQNIEAGDLATPVFDILGPDGEVLRHYETVTAWQRGMNELLGKLAGDTARLEVMAKHNKAVIEKIAERHDEGRRIIDLLGKAGIDMATV